MDCKFCNAPMEEGQEICDICGKNVNDELTEEEVAVEETVSENAFAIEAEDEEAQVALDAAEEAASVEAPKKKKGAAVLGWIIAIVLAAVIALAGVFVYDALTSEPVEPESVTLMGGTVYTVETATEEQLTTVVASAEKMGIIRSLKEKLGMEPKMAEGLTNAELSMYYWDAFYNFYNQYGYYAMMMGLDPATMDTTDSGMGGEGVTQTWQEYFLSAALNQYHVVTAVCAAAEAEGFTLPEEMATEFENMKTELSAMEDIAQQLVNVYGEGLTLEDYLAYVHAQYLSSAYLAAKQEAITCTDEELSAYYDANAESYQANGIEKTTAEDAVDSAAEAEKIYAEWQAGEATEESFAALAAVHTTDPGSQETGGLYEDVTEGMMVPAFNDWCFDEARQTGDTGIVETEYGHHIMYFVASNDDGTVDVRHILLQSTDPDAWKETVKADLVSHKMQELMDGLKAGYVLDYAPERMVLTLPGQITATAEAQQAPVEETVDVPAE